MSFLQLSKLKADNIPDNIDLSQYDTQSIIVDNSYQLNFKILVEEILKILKRLKNRAAWHYIKIEYKYFDFRLGQKSDILFKLVDLNKNYLKRIQATVIRIISDLNHFERNKLIETDYPDPGRARRIIIKKITTYKKPGKRVKRSLKALL